MRVILLISISVSLLFISCKTTLQFGEVYFESNSVEYSYDDKIEEVKFIYENERSSYLNELQEKYSLDDIIEDNDDDMQKVLKILNWTNSRWKHDGRNSPKKNDAISILEEAQEGGRFPCFAYAIVLRDQLNSSGFKARTIYLKTKDAKRSKYPPGHVATEVYLNDLKKWIFIDGQFNVMPVINGTPINAAEFQKAITDQEPKLDLLSIDNPLEDGEYYSFVYPYLFYLDTTLDNRYNIDKPYKVNGKSSIMLVPIGAKKLERINFWDMDIENCIYTNSILDFYAKPN